jgi:hypothetical protein
VTSVGIYDKKYQNECTELIHYGYAGGTGHVPRKEDDDRWSEEHNSALFEPVTMNIDVGPL